MADARNGSGRQQDEMCIRDSSYVERVEGMRGIKAARRIVPLVAEGSGSPMETVLYALLCMDVQAGGAGLPKPDLNGVVKLAPSQQAATGRSYVKVDLLWRERKVAVEYDSDWAHGNPYALNRDATKRNALQELGYRVVSVTKDQVFDWPRFQGLSLMLVGLLGKDSSRAVRDWTEKRFEVWTTLTRMKRFGD